MIAILSKINIQPDILIFTTCSKKCGTGHLKRSLLLQKALTESGIHSTIWVNNSAETLQCVNDLPKHRLNLDFQVDSFNPKAYEGFNLVLFDVSWVDPLIFKNEVKFAELFDNLDKSNTQVVTMGRPFIDSYAIRSFIDIYPDGKRSKSSGNISPKYICLREPFTSERTHIKKLCDESRKTIFVTMGGTDPFGMLSDVIKIVSEIDFVKTVYIMASGLSKSKIRKIQEIFDETDKDFILLENVTADVVAEKMLSSSCVISAFGTTAFEAMSLGVPVIALAHYEYQSNSAKWFSELNSVLYAGCAETDIDWPQLKYHIEKLHNDNEAKRRLTEFGQKYVDGKGLIRVVNHLKELLEEGRGSSLDELFIFAHPGMEVLVASGTIEKLVAANKRIGILIVGDGIQSRAHSHEQVYNTAQLHIELEDAFENSSKKLNIPIRYFLRFPDNEFDTCSLLDFVKPICRIISRHKPKRIRTHLPTGLNLDHKTVHEAVMIAARPVNECSVEQILGVKIPGADDWAAQTHSDYADNWFEEVSNNPKSRKEAFLFYEKIGYFTHSAYDFDLNEQRKKICGVRCGVAKSEAYTVIRSLSKI